MTDYFISWTPRESRESYNNQDKTVEYDIYFKALTVDGNPCTIVQWFQRLFAITKAEGELAAEAFILASLGIPTVRSAAGIWNPCSDEYINETQEGWTESELFQWLKDHFFFERYGKANPLALLIGTTLEFDYEFAFFHAEAAKEENKEANLGAHLGKYLTWHEDGTVTCSETLIRYSAYL